MHWFITSSGSNISSVKFISQIDINPAVKLCIYYNINLDNKYDINYISRIWENFMLLSPNYTRNFFVDILRSIVF